MRHALVTGGEGFIGSRLAAALSGDGVHVSVLDLPDRHERPSGLELLGASEAVASIAVDLTEAGSFETALARARGMADGLEVDTVFHLAAQTIVGAAVRDPSTTYEANITATWRVLEGCRSSDEITAILVASSDKAYGPSRELPYREPMPLSPASPYEASKAACDLLARAHARTYGLPLAVTRLANVYGGGDTHRSRLVPEAVSAVLAGRRPEIRSDGTPERDFLHVSDAVAAYIALAGAVEDGLGHGFAFNAGTGRPVAVAELLQTLSAQTGVELEPAAAAGTESLHEIDRQFVDPAALRELTGWQAEVGLEEGLAEAVEWYRANPGATA